MNPEIEKQIVSLIEAAKQTGSDAVSFITQQAPDVIAQLIRWKICEGVFWLALGVALLWGALWLFRLTWRKHSESHVDEVVWFATGLAAVTMSVTGFFLTFVGVTQTMKATVAPKVLVLEMVTEAVRSKNK